MGFEVGKTYGDYDFLDVVRMSRTEIAYRVRNRLLQRLEILRVLPAHLQNDPQQVERFLREMRVHARLLHPNIVGFYHAGELDRCVIMTTECVEGVTLRDRLALGPTPWQTAVDYVRQALAALGCAHAQQIVHRDVTPENIVITPEGTVKLNGFGLAKAASSPQLTQMGAVVGSPKYSSPEQIKGSAKIDGRSDLYSLGVVLYEAVAGRPPFSFGSQFELMLAQVSQVPEPPSRVNPDVPAALDAVVLRALEKDPAQRFQTAEEFWVALGNVKGSVELEQASPALAVSVEAALRPADLAPPAPAPPAPLPEPVAAVVPAAVVVESAPAFVAPEVAVVAPEPAADPLDAVIEPAAALAAPPEPAAEPEPISEPAAASTECVTVPADTVELPPEPAAAPPEPAAASPEPVEIPPEPVVVPPEPVEIPPEPVVVPPEPVVVAPEPEPAVAVPEVVAIPLEASATPPEPAVAAPAAVAAPESAVLEAAVAEPAEVAVAPHIVPEPVVPPSNGVPAPVAAELVAVENAPAPVLVAAAVAAAEAAPFPVAVDPAPSAPLPDLQPPPRPEPAPLFQAVSSSNEGVGWKDLAIALVIATGIMTVVLVYYVISAT